MLAEELDVASRVVVHMTIHFQAETRIQGVYELSVLFPRILQLKLYSVVQLVCEVRIELVPVGQSLEHIHLLFDLLPGRVERIDD